jgi:NAD(P)-dependent dehydrogenase (short-subunit alcohol dehydrogenase family)
LLTTQRVAQIMRRQELHPATGCRGKIINVSSAAAEVGRPLHAAYGASKAALNHLSKTSALVLAEWGIATTVLYPGNVLEGMWQRLQYEVAAAEGRTVEEVVRERGFQPAEEVAALALGIAAAPGMSMNGRLVWYDGHDTPL